MSKRLHEYAFDVKLAAVVRVRAEDEQSARAEMERVVDALDMTENEVKGWNAVSKPERGVVITEASLCVDDAGGPILFEKDGGPVDD